MQRKGNKLMSKDFPWFGACRLWLNDEKSCLHQFMAVRKKIVLEKAVDQAVFRIMADSNFIDYVKIHCRSGKGGAGSLHFHRAKYVPKCIVICIEIQP